LIKGKNMKINITPPRYYLDFFLHTKTKKYLKGNYNKLKAWDIFEKEATAIPLALDDGLR